MSSSSILSLGTTSPLPYTIIPLKHIHPIAPQIRATTTEDLSEPTLIYLDPPKENGSLGQQIHQLLSTISSPFTMNDLNSIRYQLPETNEQIEGKNPDGTIARFQENLIEKRPNGEEIFHYKGDIKKISALQYAIWKATENETALVALPLICIVTMKRGTLSLSFSFTHHVRTTIEAPLEPLSELARRTFKNKLLITLLEVARFNTIEKIQLEALSGKEIPMTAKSPNHNATIALKGFTKQSSQTFCGAQWKRTFHEYTLSKREVETNVVGKSSILKEVDCLSWKCCGPLPGQLSYLEKNMRQTDDFRTICLEYYHQKQLSRSSAPQGLFSKIPSSINVRAFGEREIQFTIETIEEMSSMMQGIFEKAQIHPQTKKTEYLLIGEHKKQYDDLKDKAQVCERYREFQMIKEKLLDNSHRLDLLQKDFEEKLTLQKEKQPSLNLLEMAPIAPGSTQEEDLKLAQLEATFEKQKLQIVSERVQLLEQQFDLEKKNHINKTTLKTMVRSIYHDLIENELKLSPLSPEASEKIRNQRSPIEKSVIEQPPSRFLALVRFSGTKRARTEQFIALLCRQKNAHRSFLLDRLLLLQRKYEEVQKSKTIIYVLQTALSCILDIRQLKRVSDICQFDEMGKAIQFLEDTVRSMPLLPTEGIDEIASEPKWPIPHEPHDFWQLPQHAFFFTPPK